MKMIRAGLYARVSKETQQIANQLEDLRTFAGRQGWIVQKEYQDHISGSSKCRPGLDAALRDASLRKFDVLLIWDLSRLTRSGPASAFEIIGRLQHCGVDMWSMREEHFRTSGPLGRLLIAVAAFVAEQERENIRERINAGMRRVRSQGVRVGRPPRVLNLEKMQAMRATGASLRKIAKAFGTAHGTIRKKLGEA